MSLTPEQTTAQNFKSFFDRIRPLLNAQHYHVDRSGQELKSCYASLNGTWSATSNTNVPFIKKSGEFIQPSSGLFTIPNGTKIEVLFTFGGNPGGDTTFGLYNNTDSLWITADGTDLKMIDPFIQSGYNYGSVLQVIWKNETGHDVDVSIRCNGVAQATTLAVDRNVLTIKEIGRIVDPVQYVSSGDNLEETPVGNIISYMGNNVPKHYLTCDGTEYLIGAYPELEAHFISEFGSVNYFGGDGTSTWAVPDLRGEFLRGTGTNSHVTNKNGITEGDGAAVGVHQRATYFPSVISQDNITYIPHKTTENTMNGYPDRKISFNDKIKVLSTSDQTQTWGEYDMYTSRPTNTSVKYCIKYETTYHVIVPSHEYRVHATYNMTLNSSNNAYEVSALTYQDGDSSLIEGTAFKAPVNGWYAVSFNSGQESKTKLVVQYLQIFHNGTMKEFTDGSDSQVASNTTYWGINVNKTVYLEKGDTVNIRIWTQGTAITLPTWREASFCLLTSNYKENIIAGGEVYSTDEQEIGTWTNGKKLYQKTIRGTTLSSASLTDWTEVTTVDTNMDTCVKCDAAVYLPSSGFFFANYEDGSFAVKVYNGKIYMRLHTAFTSKTYFVTLQYTKTTDVENQYTYKNSLLLTRPDLWDVGVEYDFGGGLYGYRITGTNVTVPANGRVDIPIVTTGTSSTKIVNVGGSIEGGSWKYAIPSSHMITSGANEQFVWFNKTVNGFTQNTILLYLATNSTTAVPYSNYDVWVTYRKA